MIKSSIQSGKGQRVSINRTRAHLDLWAVQVSSSARARVKSIKGSKSYPKIHLGW